jgi:tRNA(Ile)-lysidine synthase
VIRPLLGVSRAELRGYLVEHGERWIDDESNADLGNPRNRIRHAVLPELDCAAGGSAGAAIARAANLIREDGEWLDELARRRYLEMSQPVLDGVAIEASVLMAEAPPLRRRILLQALRAGAGGREAGFDHVEAALAALAGTSGGADVPGGRVELRRGKLVLIQQKPVPK